MQHIELVSLVGISACVLFLLWRPTRSSTGRDSAAQRAYEAFTSNSYFGGLDGLRAISVAAVIWTHVTGPHALELLNHGNKGVDLFFAISGFLVTTLLLKERRRTGEISLRAFYIRRTLRIFPLYYAVLALYCVLVYATLRGTPKGAQFWQNLPAFATYTSNWFVGLDNGADHGVTFYFAWSLATEEQFYLFWPPLLAASLALVRRSWLPAVIALLLVVVQVLAAGHPEGFGQVILSSLAPAILFGVALSVLLNSEATFRAAYPVLGSRFMAPGAVLALLACLQLGAPNLLTNFVMAVLVASVCIRQDTWIHPALNFRPLVFIGTISYGIYLMHMLAANAVRAVLGHQAGIDVFFGTLLVAVALAFLSFRFFEAPILRLKSRVTAKPRTEAGVSLTGAATTT